MSNLLTILKNKRIPHTINDNGFITVSGDLNLMGTGITALPDDFSCDSIYLNPEKISNVAYRTNCGNSSRTIFAVLTQNNYRIAAGCFFGTVDEFEAAVDRSYRGSAAETYKQKARECVNELTEKLNNWQ